MAPSKRKERQEEIARARRQSVFDRVKRSLDKKSTIKMTKDGMIDRRSEGCSPSDAELLLRLRIVEKALINGRRGDQVWQVLKNEGIDVHYTTCVRYIKAVRNKWEQEDQMMRPIWRERQLRKLHDIASEIEKERAWGHWVSVQQLIAKVEGNLQPVRVEYTQTDDFEGWTLDELEKFVATNGKETPRRFGDRGGIGGGELIAGRGNGSTDTMH